MRKLYTLEIFIKHVKRSVKKNLTTTLKFSFAHPFIPTSPSSGVVEIYGEDFDDEYITQRGQGFLDYMRQHYPSATVKALKHTGN